MDAALDLPPLVKSWLKCAEQGSVTQNPSDDVPSRHLLAPQPNYAPASAPSAPPTSGMAVASLVLGIVGVMGGWCTFAVPCVLAIIFGYVGLGQTRGRARGGRGMAIAGLVLGLVPTGIIVLILIIGGIGVLMAPLSSVSSKISEKTSASAPAVAPQGKGPVVTMGDSLTINLADGHYLKLRMTLQLAAGQSDQLDTSIATNLAIDTYTGRAIGDLETENGREEVKQKLVEGIEAAYNGAVVDVYFTEFVTQ